MQVLRIGRDAVGLKIDSPSDRVGSLTPEALSQNHVSDAIVEIYRSYFNQTQGDAATVEVCSNMDFKADREVEFSEG